MDIDVLEGLDLSDSEPTFEGADIPFDEDNWNKKVYDPESDRGNYTVFKNVAIWSRAKKRHLNRIGCYIHQPGLSRDVTFHVIDKGVDNDGEVIFTEIGRELTRRFSNQWKAFTEGREAITHGQPIEHAGFISPAQVEDLKHLKIFTVEDLAAIPDSALPSLGHGGVTLKLRAQAHLDKSKGGHMIDKLIDEKEDLKNEVARLRTEMLEIAEEMRAEKAPVIVDKVDDEPTPPKRKRGRPRKKAK